MARYRSALPQVGGGLFLTDGGIETTLIFHDGLELPHFAAFHLLKTAEGQAALRRYFRAYAAIAKGFGAGLILESATWRASADWGARLGYDRPALAEANRLAIRLLEEIRDEHAGDRAPVVISGCIGPRGDGYVPARAMSAAEAEGYHAEQIGVFAGTAADLVTAITMNYAEEAVGITQATNALALDTCCDVAKNVAVDYSTAQQLITTAWNVFFAIVLTVSVFGWTGGKKLVGESYTDAKVKVAEQKTQRAEKKAEKKAARAQEEADGEGLLTRLRHREEEEEEQ